MDRIDRYILLADDDPAYSDALRRVLECYGFVVKATTNGREAWQAAKMMRFSLIVADYSMPEMNGIELCAKLRESEAYAKTPIIMITGMVSELGLDLPRLRDTYGLAAVFSKPFRPFELVQAINGCFEVTVCGT